MKGISPIIEGIFLVAITIFVTYLISLFMFSGARETSSVIIDQTVLRASCTYGGFFIENATFETGKDCTAGINHTIYLKVKNTGQSKLNINTIVLESSSGDLLGFDVSNAIEPGSTKVLTGIGYDSCTNFINQNETGIGYVNKIRKIYATTASCSFSDSIDIEYTNISNGNQTENMVGRYTMGLWHFNDSLNDSSGYGNNGEFGGGSVVYASGVKPAFGNGLQFDGSDSYLKINNSPSINLSGPLTIEFWIYDPPKEESNVNIESAEKESGR
jgi:hypothetical protein